MILDNTPQVIAIAESANTVLAGPTTGSANFPAFRALVSADIPANAANTTGTSGGLTGTPAITVAGVTCSSVTNSGADSCLSVTVGKTGTTSGVITLDGSTSGTSTITGPATAGTVTNPIVFSNAIGIGSATAGTLTTTAGALQAGYSGAANHIQGDGTNSRIIPMTLFKGFSFAATGNVTSYATLLSTAGFSNGSLTLVANQQLVGSTIHIKASGSITVSTTAMTLTFGCKLNATALWTGASTATSIPTTANYWELDIWIYCSAVGGSGTATMKSYGICKIYTTAGTAWPIFAVVNSVASGPATTGTQAIDIGMFFGTTETSNTCTCLYCEMTLE
jgi:hypothetical protein